VEAACYPDKNVFWQEKKWWKEGGDTAGEYTTYHTMTALDGRYKESNKTTTRVHYD